MRKRVILALGVLSLTILVTLVVWQGSFSFGDYAPKNPEQTFLFWAISTLVALLTIVVGFMLFRTAVKLYIERQTNRLGSRIRTKLIVGALALSCVPVLFLVLFGYGVMNRNLEKWFSRPGENIKGELKATNDVISAEFQQRVTAQTRWLAALPQTFVAIDAPDGQRTFFARKCAEESIVHLVISPADRPPIELCPPAAKALETPQFTAKVPLEGVSKATLDLTSSMPIDLAKRQEIIEQNVTAYDKLSVDRRQFRNLYFLYMILLAMFVLFVATWIARILADQISNPISALLGAAGEVRKGNLAYRLKIHAMDELATLVRGFNEMVQALEKNSRELESRRRFTEAILESIPTGVISINAEGKIQRINRALRGIFAEDVIDRATHLRDLVNAEDLAEIRYLMNRARRTGLAASQLELANNGKIMRLAVTVSALEERTNSGFVVVLEDTSELLRAQKTAAWQEVARRIAHELKNPLTPIALSAERIARQIDRGLASADHQRIIHECSRTIVREVESVKTLVDEFSQFARFPTAQPIRADLNEVVRNAVEVFSGRLNEIKLRVSLASDLPMVNIDPEQFKRAIVNLVDNAAEAMRDSLMKELYVTTRSSSDIVELIVTDTGCGVTADDKEKLFLPYFSTKSRGTGLGLAIVSRIVSEHHGVIRVEENKPSGASFIIEVPVAPSVVESEVPAAETLT